MNQNLRTHVLKKGCLLCLSFCLWAGSALLAQNTSISLRVKDKPLKEVLKQIETDEGYIFLYKDKTMDLERKISLDVRNASLETILRRILDEKTEFGISERQVVLYTRKEAAKTSPADTPSRKITVRGTVRDAGGNVLIGVSVVEKGTTNGTATDANGLYSIDVKSAEAILTFSYLSYKTVESAVSTRPEYVFGLNAGFNWKGLNFSMQWTGATHVNKMMEIEYRIPYTNAGGRGLLQYFYDDCWTPEHQTGTLPRAAEKSEVWNSSASTLWLRNARYLRLKTLSVGYTFSNSKRLASVGIKKLGISLTGYNLLTFTPLDFIDPESLTNNNGAYPLVKVYSVGLNVTF